MYITNQPNMQLLDSFTANMNNKELILLFSSIQSVANSSVNDFLQSNFPSVANNFNVETDMLVMISMLGLTMMNPTLFILMTHF